MTGTITIILINLVIALAEFLIAGITLLTNPKSRENRAISFLLALFGTASLSIGLVAGALSGEEKLPWFLVQSGSIYAISAVTFYVSLVILRPNVANKKWISIPTWIFILLPIAAVAVDSLAITQPLFISIQEVIKQSNDYISVNTVAKGSLFKIIRYSLIGFSVLSMLYPALWVAIKDRKTSPGNSRFAWMIFTASIIAYISGSYLPPSIPRYIPPLISNTAFALGFTYIGFTKTDRRLDLSSLPSIISNRPMVIKLRILSLMVIVPAIIIITLTSITFLRQIIINLEGEELVNQSITDAVFIDSNINKVVSSINNIANDENTISVLSARAFNLKIMSPEQQLALLEGNQNSWLNQGPDSSVSKNIMNPVKNTFLREFTAFDPRHQMIMVIDNLGGLVTASSRPESYDFRTYEFWEEVTSTRNIYISDPYIDEFTDALLITIAIPIFDKNSPTELLGMLVSNFDVKDIDFFGSSNILHNNEFTVIYTEDGNLVPVHSDHDHQTGSINDIDAFLQPTSQGNNWRLAYFNEEDSIVGWAFTRDANINPDSYVNWLVITHVNRDYVLQPVTTARNISLLLLVVVIFGSFGITFLLARMITQPLIRLTQTAEKIHEGQYDLRVEIESADEIGELGKTFNNMAEELSKLITGLEDTIQSRTAELEQRAVQMETSALVAREAASIQNVQELLDRTTHEISDRFGYYHAGIFLVDERGEYAVLQAANSSGGKRMLARGHKLQVGKVGVVGYAAGMAEPRIAQDVGADVIYYDNPDMPNTRSELALPLTVRGNVIGVLDVQSSESNAFMRNDVQALQILADQIALAIENARLIQGSKRALEELQTVYGQEALKAWQSVISGKDLAANYNPIGIDVSGEQTLSRAMTDGTGEKITKEITFRGQVIGNIDLVREREIGNWSKEEEALVEEILEQTALALENARLVNQIRLRSDQIQLLQEITSFAASLPQEEMLLEFIASKLFAGLNLNNCSIELFDSAGSICSLAASAPYNDGIGESCSIKGNEVTLEVIRSQQPSILYDIANNPLIKPDMKDMLTTRGTYSWVILPLIDRDEVVGAINLEFPSADYAVKEQDLNLFNQISAQVSTALAGSRSFQAEQIGRESAAALLEITQIASSTLDLSYVLKEVSQRSAAALQSNRCTIFFLDDAKENLNPVISQFADPKISDTALWDHFKTLEGDHIDDLVFFKQIIKTKQPFIFDAATDEKGLIPQKWLQPFGSVKVLAIPLISKNEIIGLMAYDHDNVAMNFTDENISLGLTIAGQLATTVENASLFEKTVRIADRERKVADITSKMRSSNDPNTIMETAIQELKQALKSKPPSITNIPAAAENIAATQPQNGNPAAE